MNPHGAYDSKKEHRYFQQRPWLPTIEGSVIIDPEPTTKKDNIMFCIKFKDGSYLGNSFRGGKPITTYDVDDIKWIPYFLQCEELRLKVGGDSISSHEMMQLHINAHLKANAAIQHAIEILRRHDGEDCASVVMNALTVLREAVEIN